jgi:hypothetical protein
MRVFTAGNELGDYTADEFAAYGVAESPTFNQLGGAKSPQGQGGQYYFHCPSGWGLYKNFQTGTMQVPNGIKECYLRAHVHMGGRSDGRWEIFRFLDAAGAIVFSLQLEDPVGAGATPGGNFTFNMWQGTSTSRLAGIGTSSAQAWMFRNDVWNKVELYLKLAASGGRLTLWVNDILVWDVGGAIVGPAAQLFFTQFVVCNFQQSGGGSNFHGFDNIAINAIKDGTDVDISGTTNKGRCGNGYLIGHFPAKNGTNSQLTNDYGNSTNNFNHVNQLPSQNPVNFVGTNTPNQKDTYGFPRLPEEFRSINVIAAKAYAVRNGTTISKAKFSLIPAAEAEILLPAGGGVGVALPVGGYGYITQHFEKNPNTSDNPFTPAEYNGAEAGLQFIA